MTLLAPLGLLAGLLAIPVILVHILIPRRPREPVSSLMHWSGLEHPVSAAEPWQRLRWSLLLLLQLLAVALFALALSRPAVEEAAPLAEHTIFIVDASASMAAIDGDPDRLGQAVEIASSMRAEVPEGGTASLVAATPTPLVLVEDSDDADEFERALRRIRTTGGTADFDTAFLLAESLEVTDRANGFVLISDGGVSADLQKLAPAGTRYVAVGEGDTNRAITGLSVAASPTGLTARVTIDNTGGPDATQTVRLDVDGVTAERALVDIPSGEIIEESFELPAGSRVAAYLLGEDLLAYDNQAYTMAPPPREIPVAVQGDDDFFIEHLVQSIGSVRMAGPEEVAEIVIYAGVEVPESPNLPFIAVAPPGGAPGIETAGFVDRPILTLAKTDPLLDDLDVTQIAIAQAQSISVERGEVLLGAPGAPLLVRGHTGQVPFFYLSFALEQSNLPVDVAFPILGSRMVAELSSVDEPPTGLTVGAPLPLDPTATAVVDPRGTRQTVSGLALDPVADQAGFWTIEREGSADLMVAVNVDTIESDLAPAADLPDLRAAEAIDTDVVSQAVIARSLLVWVLVALLLVLAWELWVSARAIGVPRRQWWTGLGIRALIVVLLLLAIFDPAINRADETVSTVFVVDVSDSLTRPGVSSARSWVVGALADQGGSRAAVVEVGEGATVVKTFESGVLTDADVDPGSTNLTRGLRLAESLLDGATRERIVLVSDGRPTDGDLGAQIARLAALGVPIDVHTVDSDARADAAVTGLTAPDTVAVDEAFTVGVEITSTIASEALVRLSKDGELVAEGRRDLSVGTTTVDFRVEAGADPGIERLEATVVMPGDAQGVNDTSITAVSVGGPTSVIIVEGVADNGVVLENALQSKGLVVSRVGVGDLPALEELSVYSAAVMVDVDAESLTEAHTRTLDAFVRDLGRGMVVIGGDQSFALGGYADTDFEALLPVESEIEDAKREASVAEVLLIDTSESMGSCHCRPIEGQEDDPFSGEPVEGGVNKTDISRAGAARAIEALSANDEVGVLAFNGQRDWVIPLQSLPSEQVVTEGLAGLSPRGETFITPALEEAANALRESAKQLKHIILFTDGFTVELFDEFVDEEGFGLRGTSMAEQAAALAAEGITVSVVATGEGAAPALEAIAIAGNGRFYPGRDLNEIPEIFVREARLAARSFVNEGEYYPTVVSAARPVQNLASSPPLLGYVATSLKPTAEGRLEIGEFADPLMASWRVGLGRVTTWTSDGGERWAAEWAAWDGFAEFWSGVVRDTFPLGAASGQRLKADIVGDRLEMVLESAEPWPVGTTPTASVGRPDGTSVEVDLRRVSDTEFAAEVAADQAGTYAVGVSIGEADGVTATISGLASRSYGAEYIPGASDRELMEGLSEATGGRGEISPDQAFDAEGLQPGTSRSHYRWWYLLAAALLWPIDVAVRRIRLWRTRRTLPQPPRPDRPTTPRTPSAVSTP